MSAKNFFLNIALFLGSLLFCFILIESWLILEYRQEQDRLSMKKSEGHTVRADDPVLMYMYNPAIYGINSQGYRDREHAFEKNEGVSRIVLIGDSVAMGQGVQLEYSVGKILERKLNASPDMPDRKFEVVVLARSGYSTVQQLVLLEQEALDYSPDLILWSYVLNDPAHPVFHDANGELGLYYYKPTFHSAHYVYKKLFEIREQRRLKNWGCPREYHALLHCVYWYELSDNIKKIGTITRANNVPVLFVIHPVFQQNNNFQHYSLEELHSQLGKTASSSGLEVVDLLSIYRRYKPFDLAQSDEDAWHPNRKGNRVAAEHIYDAIKAGGYLKADP